VQKIYKVSEGRPNAVDLLKNKEIQLVINTPAGQVPRADEVKIRTTAVYTGTPIMTTLSGAKAAALGIAALKKSGYASRRCRSIIELLNCGDPRLQDSATSGVCKCRQPSQRPEGTS
jgi:hypothetical protein